MALTYTWKIKNLKRGSNPSGDLDGVIVQTYWDCTGTDADGNSGTFAGATPFDPTQVDAENFTAYENLTEAMVLGWIQNEVNTKPGYKDHIEGQIQKQIDAVIKPIIEVDSTALPWAVAEETANTANTATANTANTATANT